LRSSCVRAPPTHDISTLSLHDALPIFDRVDRGEPDPLVTPGDQTAHSALDGLRRAGRLDADRRDDLTGRAVTEQLLGHGPGLVLDRKSTRLNSSHVKISYAVFCLKKNM